MARKGNPISVRLDLNRSSDSSRFSEGDRESHRRGQSFPSPHIKKGGEGRCRCPGRTRLLLTLEDHWKTPGTRACRYQAEKAGQPLPYVPIASAARAPAPSSAGEASPDLRIQHASCNLSKARREGRKLTLRKKGLLFYFDSNLRKGRSAGALFSNQNNSELYQDVNLRSYFGSIRPPTRLTFGFRLGRCIILHFPKRTFIHFFLPRRPRRQKRREKSRPGKGKGQWWAFGKVGPIGCLHSSDGTEEERNEVRARGAAKRVESIRLDDREKQNEIRIWPKKKQRYGYHDRSPSIKKNLSKSLRVSGAFKHPKYAGLVNEIALLNDDSFRKTKLFKFFFSKKSKKSPSDSPTSHPLKRTLPAVRPSLNYSVMQYLLKTKNQMHFDPVVVLNHFVEPGVLEPSTMGGANAQGRSLDKRIRFAFFVESSTSEKKFLAEDKKLTHFIRWSNHPRFAGTTKTTISLFPFFGATFFFPRDGVGVYNNLFFEYAREQLLRKFRKKCWNLMAKDKVMELIEKFIDLGGIGELIKGIEMMIEIILRNRRIPYGYNFYLNEVKKMRSLLSNRTKTNTLIESVKIKSVYQSASPIAQDISFQPRNKTRSFRSIFSQIVKDIQLVMKKGVEGIRICCSGRSEGAEIARTECKKYGKTSSNVFNQKIDYAPTEVSTRYGISDLPITGKPTEVRMGRGKGNPAGWIARVSTGQIPFEMDGVSLSNARQAATLAAHKLCASTKFVQWS
ncbi:ribosomal protein S3 [Tanacetum coccineum]